MKCSMTLEIAYAIGRDEANRQMRKEGRTAWSEDDYNLACETVNRLMPLEEGANESRKPS